MQCMHSGPGHFAFKLSSQTRTMHSRTTGKIWLYNIYKKEHAYRQLKSNGLDMLIIVTKMRTPLYIIILLDGLDISTSD